MVLFIGLQRLLALFLFLLFLLLSVCFDPRIVCVYLLFGFAAEDDIE